MPSFSLKTLFVFLTLFVTFLAIYPIANRVYQWRSGQVRLAEYLSTDYLKYGYEDVNAAAKPVFDRTMQELHQLGPFAKDRTKLAILERCVLDLNKIQYDETIEHSIETCEREVYCEIVLQLGDFVGVNFQDLLDKTRDF